MDQPSNYFCRWTCSAHVSVCTPNGSQIAGAPLKKLKQASVVGGKQISLPSGVAQYGVISRRLAPQATKGVPKFMTPTCGPRMYSVLGGGKPISLPSGVAQYGVSSRRLAPQATKGVPKIRDPHLWTAWIPLAHQFFLLTHLRAENGNCLRRSPGGDE